MAPNLCPGMSWLTCLKLISMVDAVLGAFLLSLTVLGIFGAFLGYGSGTILWILFGCLILGVLSTAQIWAAIQLYKVANGNNSQNSRISSWIVVTGIIITIFFVSSMESLREMKFGATIFFMVIIVYKIYVVFVVIKFKNSTGSEGQQRSDVYSPSNANA